VVQHAVDGAHFGQGLQTSCGRLVQPESDGGSS
jgi:hypothetical protein